MRGRGKLRKAVVSGSAFVSAVVSYESSFGSAQGMVNWLTLFAEYGIMTTCSEISSRKLCAETGARGSRRVRIVAPVVPTSAPEN
jgi:hypothetical protein